MAHVREKFGAALAHYRTYDLIITCTKISESEAATRPK